MLSKHDSKFRITSLIYWSQKERNQCFSLTGFNDVLGMQASGEERYINIDRTTSSSIPGYGNVLQKRMCPPYPLIHMYKGK